MPDQHEDQFLQRRLLIASVLSALAIMLYIYLAAPAGPVLPPGEPPAVAQTETTEQTPPGDSEAVEQQPAKKAEAAPASPEASPAAPIKKGESDQEIIVESKTFRVTFSSRGAVVSSWILKEYEDAAGKPLDLVHQEGAAESGFPFALELPGGEKLEDINQALFVADPGPAQRSAPTTVSFEYSDGNRSVSKRFQFEEDGYVLKVESELLESGSPRPHLMAWSGGFGDTAQINDYRKTASFYFDPETQKLVLNNATDVEEERIVNEGEYSYAGIDDLFFAAVFIPADAAQTVRLETTTVQIAPAPGGEKHPFAAMALGGSGHNVFQVFVGPKSMDLLESVRPDLQHIVDFGFFSFVGRPLFWMLRWTHGHIVDNWGWAIIVVTIIINVALFPLKWKSTKSMKKMQTLQPVIKQINEKYKGLSIRDPKKAQQNEEVMAVYKKYGVNPMGGCLPMVVQLPFFIAFYSMLTSAIELRHASWLWVADLSAPEQIAIRVLPLAMILTQFWQQAMTPQPTVDPAQAKMMKFMPLLMGFFFYGFSSGLVLFWLTGNVVGVAQQAILNRLTSEPLEVEQPRRGRKKK